MAIHVVVGIWFWMFQGRTTSSMKDVLELSYEGLSSIIFAFFNVVWTTLYLKSWKRKSCELTYKWGTYDTQQDILSEPRPLFQGEEKINDITGLSDVYYPAWKTERFRYFVSIPVTFACMLACFTAVILSLRFADWWDEEVDFCNFIPRVLLATSIPILNAVYENIAVWLNDMENHRTEESHKNNLIIKKILFQFINSYLSLFYVAFYLQDIERLRSLLTTILITRQVTGSVKEMIIPYATKYFKMISMSISEHQGSLDLSQITTEFSPIERESLSLKYKGTHEEYMEIFTQFGYVTFFSSIYPLAGFLALINNVFEIRGDALKLCTAYQRPFGQRVANIGAWQAAMEWMGVIAIIVNCALIGQSGQLYALFPDMSVTDMILVGVVLEHVMLLIKIILDYVISDFPSWVEKDMARVEHQRQELERRDLESLKRDSN